MAMELSEVMNQSGRVLEWADRVTYKDVLSDEDKEIASALDQWAKKVGQTGFDEKHEISALIRKSIAADDVENVRYCLPSSAILPLNLFCM